MTQLYFDNLPQRRAEEESKYTLGPRGKGVMIDLTMLFAGEHSVDGGNETELNIYSNISDAKNQLKLFLENRLHFEDDIDIDDLPNSVLSFNRFCIERNQNRPDTPELQQDDLVLRLQTQILRCGKAG